MAPSGSEWFPMTDPAEVRGGLEGPGLQVGLLPRQDGAGLRRSAIHRGGRGTRKAFDAWKTSIEILLLFGPVVFDDTKEGNIALKLISVFVSIA